MSKTPPPTQNRFEAFFRRGTQLLHDGLAAKALPMLEKAYEIEPDNPDAALNLSGAYILTNKFIKAIPILEEVSKKSSDNEMVWINLGAAYLGNPVLATDEAQQKAVMAFEKALEINPEAPNVAYNLGLIYRDRREYDEAISWFKRALQTNPKDRDARNFIRKMSQQK